MRYYCIVFAVFLTACATKPPPPIWLRTDGQSAANDPVLAQQFQVDKTVCLGEREKADLSGVTVTQGGIPGLVAAQNRANAADAVAQGCMAQKGYILVPADQAAAKSQELASIAAEKARRETEAAAAVAAQAKQQKVAAKPKPKPQPPSAPPAQAVSLPAQNN